MTTKTKVGYTPGPWKSLLAPLQIVTDRNIICTLNKLESDIGSEVINGNEYANANLIASAPELLEACIYLTNALDENMKDATHDNAMTVFVGREMVSQAIAKAEGRI